MDGTTYRYKSIRRSQPLARLDMVAELGAPLGPSAPGSLQHFLIERYLLYALHPGLGLMKGRVFHDPYTLLNATLLDSQDGLLASAGISPSPWRQVCFSPGVDVEVFAPEPI